MAGSGEEERLPRTRHYISTRLSDSGAILHAEGQVSTTSFRLGSFIHEAGCLLGLNPQLFAQPTQSILRQSQAFPRIGGGEQAILCLVKKVESKPDCGSSTTSRMSSAAGLTTRKRDIEGSQV